MGAAAKLIKPACLKSLMFRLKATSSQRASLYEAFEDGRIDQGKLRQPLARHRGGS